MTRSFPASHLVLVLVFASCAHAAAPVAAEAPDASPAAAPAAPVAVPTPEEAAAPSGSVEALGLDYSGFNWQTNSAAPAAPPPGATPPPAAADDDEVTDADVQAEIARIRAELGTVEAAPPPPLAADQCTGLRAYVAAAPDAFKAVLVVGPYDSAYTHEWKASPGLPRWDRCTISDAAARPYLSCDYFSMAVVDYASEYASLAQQVESCFPGWERVVDVANKADKHWKTSYGAGTRIIISQYLDKGGYKQALVVHQD